ncbi:type II secretion system F family protein [Thermogutta sp.]|uniref:type II secretion system F family protein n=2 Tax=Thermogutta sp. TaxID=1962930 RepID=UPI003C7B618F
MLLGSRITKRQLVQLCQRMATQIEAGVDLRTICRREAERATGGAYRRAIRVIAEAVNKGYALADALALTEDYFPRLFLQIVRIGEETGKLPEAFRLLGRYYEEEIARRRTFWSLLVWPLFELTFAIIVIGFLIWIMGEIGKRGDVVLDPLGFGLVGERGLLIYLTIVGCCATGIGLLIWASRRGLLWTRPIQMFVDLLPILGDISRTLALARFTWALSITLRSSLDVRVAVDLALQAAEHPAFTALRRPVWASIQAGHSLSRIFEGTGLFPVDWLDAFRVGEESGKLDEVLERLSRLCMERASRAMKVLSVVGAVLVTLLIATLIIFMIFRLAMFYIGQIYSAIPQ